jgi:hypothetical protein
MRLPISELLDTPSSFTLKNCIRSVSKTVPGVASLEKCFVPRLQVSAVRDTRAVGARQTGLSEV